MQAKREQEQQILQEAEDGVREDILHWKEFKLLAQPWVVLWVCRFAAFLWVYTYHTQQSLFILTFILLSVIIQKISCLYKTIVYFYIPIFVLIFLTYYTTNIPLLIFKLTDDPGRHF